MLAVITKSQAIAMLAKVDSVVIHDRKTYWERVRKIDALDRLTQTADGLEISGEVQEAQNGHKTAYIQITH